MPCWCIHWCLVGIFTDALLAYSLMPCWCINWCLVGVVTDALLVYSLISCWCILLVYSLMPCWCIHWCLVETWGVSLIEDLNFINQVLVTPLAADTLSPHQQPLFCRCRINVSLSSISKDFNCLCNQCWVVINDGMYESFFCFLKLIQYDKGNVWCIVRGCSHRHHWYILRSLWHRQMETFSV